MQQILLNLDLRYNMQTISNVKNIGKSKETLSRSFHCAIWDNHGLVDVKISLETYGVRHYNAN